MSNRLEETPAVIVTGQYGNSANMERIMKAQAFSSDGGNAYLMSAKTAELNARHPLVSKLPAFVSDGDDESTRRRTSRGFCTKRRAWCGGIAVGCRRARR